MYSCYLYKHIMGMACNSMSKVTWASYIPALCYLQCDAKQLWTQTVLSTLRMTGRDHGISSTSSLNSIVEEKVIFMNAYTSITIEHNSIRCLIATSVAVVYNSDRWLAQMLKCGKQQSIVYDDVFIKVLIWTWWS